jgi:uncharacterized membrane protein
MSQAVLSSAPANPLISSAAPTVRPRLDSVDWLRGLVMVVMALDHVRDFFGDMSFNAIDPHQTTVRHFFTRWVTHFCAPTFIFLTGVGIFLTGARGRTKPQLAWFVFTRGLWLIVLELTYIRFFWMQFDLTYEVIPLGVFWAIGTSMVLLAPLLLLPDWFVIGLGLALVLGHNALDGIRPEDCGAWGWLWKLVHGQGDFTLFADPAAGRKGIYVGTAYKMTWVGVMMAGYGFGRVLLWERRRRQRFIVGLGLTMVVAFFALRGANVYGDRLPRLHEPDPKALAELEQHRAKASPTVCPPLQPATFAALSFLNCEKYPPSLAFLLMTLGPALLLLAAADRLHGPLSRVLVTFGRVPLFYYLLHIALIVPAVALWYFAGYALGVYGPIDEARRTGGLHVPLWGVYLLWLAAVTVLYFPCRWYADVKRRSRSAWLSYL